MTKHIYLTGYSTHKPDALKRLAENLDAVVVDIRLNPVSRVPHWNRLALIRLLGDYGYAHLPMLGNLNYKNGGRIAIRNIDLGTQQLLNFRHDKFLLLCACSDPCLCHRTVVGEHLSFVYGLSVREVTKLEWALAGEQMEVVQVGDQMALFS